MTKPQRIQRSRAKGWRMPGGAIYVGRGSRWGNPFHGHDLASMAAVHFGQRGDTQEGRNHGLAGLHAHWLAGWPQPVPPVLAALLPSPMQDPPKVREIREALAGHDLMCWCAPGLSCHADTLLAIANGPPPAF